jgi:hypothetical protein
MGKSKGSGEPISLASWVKEYWVLAMQIGILSKPIESNRDGGL